GSRVAIEDINGNVMSLDLSSHTLSDWVDSSNCVAVIFPSVCHVIHIYPPDNSICGLSSNYCLYRNNQLVLKSCCTSFLIHDNRFLVYTTTSHELRWSDLESSNISSKNLPDGRRKPLDDN